jgi:hypothetical protein
MDKSYSHKHLFISGDQNSLKKLVIYDLKESNFNS